MSSQPMRQHASAPGGIGNLGPGLDVLGCALAGYFFIRHLVRAPFGVALQGIRDNPRRMASLGFHVTAHRVAAYAVAGLLAAAGGVLMVWYNGRISPGTANLGAMISILIIAVLAGGLYLAFKRKGWL